MAYPSSSPPRKEGCSGFEADDAQTVCQIGDCSTKSDKSPLAATRRFSSSLRRRSIAGCQVRTLWETLCADYFNDPCAQSLDRFGKLWLSADRAKQILTGPIVVRIASTLDFGLIVHPGRTQRECRLKSLLPCIFLCPIARSGVGIPAPAHVFFQCDFRDAEPCRESPHRSDQTRS